MKVLNYLLLTFLSLAITGCSRNHDPLASIDPACAGYFSSKLPGSVILDIDDKSKGDLCTALVTFDHGENTIRSVAFSASITRFKDDKFTVDIADAPQFVSGVSVDKADPKLLAIAWEQWLKRPAYASCEDTWKAIAGGELKLNTTDACHKAPPSVLVKLIEGDRKRMAKLPPMPAADACKMAADTLKDNYGDYLSTNAVIYTSAEASGDERCTATLVLGNYTSPNQAREVKVSFNLRRLNPENAIVEHDEHNAFVVEKLNDQTYLFDPSIPEDFTPSMMKIGHLNEIKEEMGQVLDALQRIVDIRAANPGITAAYVDDNETPLASPYRDININNSTILGGNYDPPIIMKLSHLPPSIIDTKQALRLAQLIPQIEAATQLMISDEGANSIHLNQITKARVQSLKMMYDEGLQIETALANQVQDAMYKITATTGALKGQRPYKKTVNTNQDVSTL